MNDRRGLWLTMASTMAAVWLGLLIKFPDLQALWLSTLVITLGLMFWGMLFRWPAADATRAQSQSQFAIQSVDAPGQNIFLYQPDEGIEQFVVGVRFRLWTRDALEICNIELSYHIAGSAGKPSIVINSTPIAIDTSYHLANPYRMTAGGWADIWVRQSFASAEAIGDEADYGRVKIRILVAASAGPQRIVISGRLAAGGRLAELQLSTGADAKPIASPTMVPVRRVRRRWLATAGAVATVIVILTIVIVLGHSGENRRTRHPAAKAPVQQVLSPDTTCAVAERSTEARLGARPEFVGSAGTLAGGDSLLAGRKLPHGGYGPIVRVPGAGVKIGVSLELSNTANGSISGLLIAGHLTKQTSTCWKLTAVASSKLTAGANEALGFLYIIAPNHTDLRYQPGSTRLLAEGDRDLAHLTDTIFYGGVPVPYEIPGGTTWYVDFVVQAVSA